MPQHGGQGTATVWRKWLLASSIGVPTFLVAAFVFAAAGGPVKPVDASNSADLRSYQKLADKLSGQVGGNGGQREAADYLRWFKLNGPVKSCMQASGMPYRATFTSGSEGYEPHGLGGAWLMKPHLRIVSQQAQGHVWSARKQAQMMKPLKTGALERTKSYRNKLRGCQERAGDPKSVALPSGMRKLRTGLNSLVSSVDREVGQPQQYVDCMGEHGVDTSRFHADEEGFDATYMYLTGLLPNASKIPARGEPTNSDWTKFRNTEDAVLDADAMCRQSIYEDGMMILGPQLEHFQSRHATEIEKVQNGWKVLVNRARAQGWQPL